MPTKIPHYSATWVAKRRAVFFKGKQCVQCGSKDRLELDHINPADKLHHRIWSWTEERRKAEIAKCQVLCHDCHKGKTSRENSIRQTGRANLASRKLSPEQVARIIELRKGGSGVRTIARYMGVCHSTISRLLSGTHYYRDLVGAGNFEIPTSRSQAERSAT